MDSYRTSNPESRAVAKFYDSIRFHLDDIVPPTPSETSRIRDRLRDVKEEDAYGLISKAEFEAILQAYDGNSDKPTKCDRFEAGSFAKLLYSKPGFHHPDATAYLVGELKLKDKNRDSFLGGHSTYETPEQNSISNIKKFQQKIYIRERTKELFDAMEIEPLDPRIQQDIDDLFKIDDRDPNILAVSGRYNMKIRYFEPAIKFLKDAEALGCDHIVLVKKYISEALYHRGAELFGKYDYERAHETFCESLLYDNTNEGSILYQRMCSNKIAEQRRPIGYGPDTFHSRRR